MTGEESRAAISASAFANVSNQNAAFANGSNQSEAVRAKYMELALECGKVLAHDGSQSVCSDVRRNYGTSEMFKAAHVRVEEDLDVFAMLSGMGEEEVYKVTWTQ